jgi:Flp pilus assembly protein TadG
VRSFAWQQKTIHAGGMNPPGQRGRQEKIRSILAAAEKGNVRRRTIHIRRQIGAVEQRFQIRPCRKEKIMRILNKFRRQETGNSFAASSIVSIGLSDVRGLLSDQRGQTLPFVALLVFGMLGVSGLVVDVGHAYVVRSELQNSANAAALAAAEYVYTSSTATVNPITEANQYGPGSGGENAQPGLSNVTTTVTTECLNLLMPTGQACGSGSPANALKVVNSTGVKTFFMGLFGVPTLTVGATATASMQGQANPWNVAIIVDGTQSMSTADSNCGGLTEFQCALGGVQAFLGATNPCPAGVTTCTLSTSILRVSLFSFPNLSTASGFSASNTCAGPFTNEVYTLPTTTATTYAPIQYTGASAITATYQLAGWDSDYYKPGDSTTGQLNPSDNLVKAIGYGYNSSTGAIASKGCLPNVGGESTYYAGVIYAAQAALLEEQKSFPASKNAMILLSDGQANAAPAKFPQKTSDTTAGIDVTSAGSTSGGSSSYNLTGVAGTYGLYPDFVDECQQAIAAAQSATSAGTRVYAVAYGAEDDGCAVAGSGATLTDTTLVATGVNAPFTLSSLLPCVTMENMASSLQYFYSDSQKSGSDIDASCVDASHPVSSATGGSLLQQIFLSISSNFTKPKLLPNNAT